jgi:hypothetical protein
MDLSQGTKERFKGNKQSKLGWGRGWERTETCRHLNPEHFPESQEPWSLKGQFGEWVESED